MMKNALLLVIVTLAVLVNTTYGAATNQTNQTILTVDQKHLRTIEGSLSPVDFTPCKNFFKYACGEWHNFEKSLGSENLQVLDYRIRQQMMSIVESFGNITSGPKFLTEVYNYYQSCKHRAYEEPLDYLTWLNDHENVSWPLVTDEPVPQQWLDLLALTRRYGYNEIFFHEDVVQRRDDPLQLVIEFKRPAVTALDDFNKQMYGLRNKIEARAMQQFSQFQMDLLKLTLELIKTEENGDLEFIQNTMSQPSEVETRLVALRELQMPWLNRYLQMLLNRGPIDPDMQVYVHSVTYLQRIYEFVNGHDNRFLCDYIQIKFLQFLKDRDSSLRRGSCLQSIRHQFPLVMQWVYEKNHLELQWQTSLIRNIFNNLKGQFKLTLNVNTYSFGEEMMDYLRNKLDKLQLIVGDLSLEELEHYYEQLSLDAADYYGNRLKVFHLNFQVPHDALNRSLTSNSVVLLQQISYDDRIDKILTLYNLPHLHPRLNAIFLPVTMIQAPYYEDGLSDLYTYSSIGFLLAHEIAKAFGQRYLHIDANGKDNVDMYNSMLENSKFRRTNERLRRDFHEENYNAEEVIDDLGGLKLAYDTFAELHPHVFSQTVTIDNRRMTREKVFFLNYAQNFCGPLCGTSTMGYFYYDLCDRVNKPTMHFSRFQHAFKCTEYDQGHPIWH